MFKRTLCTLLVLLMLGSMMTMVYAVLPFDDGFEDYNPDTDLLSNGWGLVGTSKSASDGLTVYKENDTNKVLKYYDYRSGTIEQTQFTVKKTLGNDLTGKVKVKFRMKVNTSSDGKRIKFKDRDIVSTNSGNAAGSTNTANQLFLIGQWGGYLKGPAEFGTIPWTDSNDWFEFDITLNLTGTATGNTADFIITKNGGIPVVTANNVAIGGTGKFRCMVIDTDYNKNTVTAFFDDFYAAELPSVEGAVSAENNTISMKSLTEVDENNNSITVNVTNGTPKDGELAPQDYEIQNLPEGITASGAAGDSVSKTITFTFAGAAASSITSDVPLQFVIKKSAITESDFLDSLAISGGSLISFVKNIVLSASDSLVKLSSMNSVASDNNTFAVNVTNGTLKDGSLNAEDYTVTGLPDGLSVTSAAADSAAGTVVFTVGGLAASSITENTALSVVIKQSAMQTPELFRDSAALGNIWIETATNTIEYNAFTSREGNAFTPVDTDLWSVSNGIYKVNLASGGYKFSFYNELMSDCIITSDCAWPFYNQQTGIVTNYTDENNYYMFMYESAVINRFRIVTNIGGKKTWVNGDAVDPQIMKGKLKFVVNGNSLKGYNNNTLVVSTTLAGGLPAGKTGLFAMKSDSTYSLSSTFDNVTISQKVTQPLIAFEDISISDANEFTGKITNVNMPAVDNKAVIAVYKNNQLYSVYVKDCTGLASGDSYALSQQLSLPEDGEYETKLLVFNSWEGLTPVKTALYIR